MRKTQREILSVAWRVFIRDKTRFKFQLVFSQLIHFYM